MKRVITLSFVGFIICTAFNKPKVLTTDYRDAYTGTYFCKSSCSQKNPDSGKPPINTNDTLSIAISKDAADSILQIKYANQILKVKLLSKNLRAYPSSGHYGGTFFASDSLDLRIAQGRAHSCRYLGKKK